MGLEYVALITVLGFLVTVLMWISEAKADREENCEWTQEKSRIWIDVRNGGLKSPLE